MWGLRLKVVLVGSMVAVMRIERREGGVASISSHPSKHSTTTTIASTQKPWPSSHLPHSVLTPSQHLPQVPPEDEGWDKVTGYKLFKAARLCQLYGRLEQAEPYFR